MTLEKLRTHQTLQVEERKLAGDAQHFKRLLKEAGLPDIRFHDLSHPAATLMLQQGTRAKIAQERLGHSDISLTLNTYSHVLPSMQEEAAENKGFHVANRD